VLTGRVLNALTGEPLKKATVRLTKNVNGRTPASGASQPQGPQGYTTTSETDGNFKIENIEPGDYRLSGDRSGYLNTQYGAKSVGRQGSTITLLPGQQLTNISLALTPQAVISGKVVDQDGDPVNGVMVQLIGQMWQRGKLRHMPQGGSNTNDLGEYRIANVHPGKYYVFVQRMRYMPEAENTSEPGKPDIRPVRTFYPEAASVDSATQLDVKAGQDLTGIDVRLRSAPTFHIRGKIAGALPEGIGDQQLSVNAMTRGDETVMFMFGGGGRVTKDRSFDIAGMAPGSYTVNIFAMNGQVRALGRQDVEVGEADVSDVQVTLVPPGSLHGQITLEGNPQPGATANVKTVHIFLSPGDNGPMMFDGGNATPKDDGTFVIDNVTPGKYFVSVNAPQGTYLKSLRFGSEEILGKALNLSQGSGQVTVVFSYAPAELDGTVQLPPTGTEATDAAAGQPVQTPDASVVLVPEKLNEDGSGMHFTDTGAGGTFTLRQIPPGRYRAYAFEKVQYQELQNPDLLKELEPKGTEIELKQNDKKQIQLPLISDGDMQQIYARLGLEAPHD
jgi:hypothetical protein